MNSGASDSSDDSKSDDDDSKDAKADKDEPVEGEVVDDKKSSKFVLQALPAPQVSSQAQPGWRKSLSK